MMDLQFTKICFKCGEQKEKTKFYKHPQMGDGRLNKCIECTKKDTALRTEILTSTPEGLEKERKRQREKYKRLGYNEKQKVWNEKRPWKKDAILKNLSRKLKVEKGFECHHWSYNYEHFEDVFILEIKQHRQAHRFLEFNPITKMFNDENGNSLYTKTIHMNYLMSKGIEIKQY
jgi:hypothetical protein